MIATATEVGTVLLVRSEAEYIDDYFLEPLRQSSQGQLEIFDAPSVADAYWWFATKGSSCQGIVLDLSGSKTSNAFDGMDLAVALDSITGPRETRPALVIIASSPREEIEFVRRQKFGNLDFRGIIHTNDSGALRADLNAFATFLSTGRADAFGTSYQFLSTSREDQVITYEDATLERSEIYRQVHKTRFVALCNAAFARLFASYTLIHVSCLTPGLGGSDVFGVKCSRNDDAATWKAFVIKMRIDNAGEIVKEANTYFEFCELVKEHVPLLIGPLDVTVDGLSAKLLCFEFVGPSPDRVITYGSYLGSQVAQSTRLSTLEIRQTSFATLDLLFGHLLRSWHIKDRVTSPSSQCYTGWRPRIEAFKEVLRRTDQVLYDAFSRETPTIKLDDGIGLELTNPAVVIRKLFEHGGDFTWDRVLNTGIVHGDLHCDNIVTFGGSTRIWKLIDFRHVRSKGHIAQDFARLECDVKFRWLPVALPQDVRYRLEFDLAEDAGFPAHKMAITRGRIAKAQESQIHFAKTTIQNIRLQGLNRLEVPQADLRGRSIEYHIALLFQCLFYYEKIVCPQVRSHAFLAACLAAELVSGGLQGTPHTGTVKRPDHSL